ncbi:MAG: hypothetical protein ACLFQV_01625 [Vulcanimicrobiota bacterium]
MLISKIQDKLERLLLICREEWKPLSWLLVLNFILASGAIIAFSVINALLIIQIGFEAIPRALLISGLVLLPYLIIYNYLESKVSRKALITGSFALYAVAVAFAGHTLTMEINNYRLLMTLYVLSTSIALLVNLQFWSVSNSIFNPRQGKRLFPILSMGGALGALITGFSLSLITNIVESPITLLYIWAGLFVICSLITIIFYKPVQHLKPETVYEQSFLKNTLESFTVIKTIPVMKIMALIIFIMSVVSFIIYFQFYRAVGQQIPNAMNFIGFVGNFNGILNLGIIIMQLFLTARVIGKMGITNSLYIHPALLFFPVIGNLFFQNSFIPPAVFGRYVDLLCQETFFKTASEAIYGAVKDELREKAMSFIKIIVTPFSMGLAGFSLLAFIKWQTESALLAINILLPFVLIIWIIAIYYLKNLYIETLFGNFVKKEEKKLDSYRAISQLGGDETLRLIRRPLQYGNDNLKEFALKLAGELKIKVLKNDMLEFLENQNPKLRNAAIESLGKFEDKKLFPRLMKNYKNENREIKLQILNSLRQLDRDSFYINAPLLLVEEEDSLIKCKLLDYTWSQKPLLYSQQEIFKGLLKTADPDVKACMGNSLKYDKEHNFKEITLELLNDKNPNVVLNTLNSLEQNTMPEAAEKLIALLAHSNNKIAGGAMNVLIKGKQKTIPQVRESISPENSNQVLKRKYFILSCSKNLEDNAFFLEQVSKHPPSVIKSGLKNFTFNLSALRTFSRDEQKIIGNFINVKIEQLENESCSALALKKQFENDPENVKFYEILKILLKERFLLQKKIIILGLHLLYPEEKILTLYKSIFSRNTRKKNIALEVLDNILPIETKNRVIPLFEKNSLESAFTETAKNCDRNINNIQKILELFYKTSEPLIVSWVYFTAGKLGIKEWEPEIKKGTESKNLIICEHAKQALVYLNNFENR